MIVAGFGFRGGANIDALRAALASAQCGHPAVTALATPDDKQVAPAQLARELGIPLIAISAEALQSVSTPTRSAVSLYHRGAGSVAEAAALAAVGPGGRLLATRHISPDRMATCAIAEAPAVGSAA